MVFPPPSMVLWSGANFHQREVVQLFCTRRFQKGGCFARRRTLTDKLDAVSCHKVCGAGRHGILYTVRRLALGAGGSGSSATCSIALADRARFSSFRTRHRTRTLR